MNIGLTTSHGRMAPCFAGTDLWVVGADDDAAAHRVVSTAQWRPMFWGHELMRRDIGLLLCAGIDRFLWGAFQGFGIRVIPDTTGTPEDVVAQWRAGRLVPPPMWPPCRGTGGWGRGRRRCRRGAGW